MPGSSSFDTAHLLVLIQHHRVFIFTLADFQRTCDTPAPLWVRLCTWLSETSYFKMQNQPLQFSTALLNSLACVQLICLHLLLPHQNELHGTSAHVPDTILVRPSQWISFGIRCCSQSGLHTYCKSGPCLERLIFQVMHLSLWTMQP